MSIFLILGPIFLAVGIYLNIAGGYAGQIASITFMIIGVVFTALGYFFRKMGAKHKRLMAVGTPGTGTIISVSETSMRINNNPVVAIEMDVVGSGFMQFRTTMKTPVSPVTLSQVNLKPGASLPVKVDPSSPQKNMIVDWNAAISQNA